MTSLTFSQLEEIYAGDAEIYAGSAESGDFWQRAAELGCAAWGIGRAFFGVAISCAASPLTGAICTGIVDAACAALAAAAGYEIIAG